MAERENYRLLLVLRAVDKITQMSGTSGNEAIINRGEFLHEGEVVRVPKLSSNGLRHCAVREPGGLWLIEQYGLLGKLSKDELRLLVGGGNNASESGGAESLRKLEQMRRHWPLLSLMGCGLPDGPKKGALKFSDAVLVCAESRAYIETIGAGIIDLPDQLRRGRTCVGKWTQYRHDPALRDVELLSDADLDGEADHSGMIFGGEAIIPGALLVSEIHLESATTLELGCLAWSLRLWQKSGGHIGGMSARGNGRTTAMLHVDGDVDLDAAVEAYLAYAVESRDEALEWLTATYHSGPKPRQPRKGKAK